MLRQGAPRDAERDTAALALFLTGQVQRALELQEIAARRAGSSTYTDRLERYRKAAAQQQEKAAGDKAGDDKAPDDRAPGAGDD